jgi:cytochrome P450
VGWVVTRHADVRAVLDDSRFVVPPPPAGGEVGTLAWLRASVSRFSGGPEHRRRRGIVLDELRPVDVPGLRRSARERTEAELRRAGCRLDVMARLARRVPVGALGSALGVGDGDLQALVTAVTAVAAAYRPEAAAAAGGADAAVARLAGLLPPGAPDLTANRIGLLVQACDATAALIGNALHAALRGPAAEVRRWPVEAVLAETLRWDPPNWNTRRVGVEGAVLAGRPLDAGTAVLLHLRAANRDPAVFEDPDRFDPTRPRRPHLTFGHGPRPCPGAEHALALAGGVVGAVLAAPCALAGTELRHEPARNLRIPAALEVQPRRSLARP